MHAGTAPLLCRLSLVAGKTQIHSALQFASQYDCICFLNPQGPAHLSSALLLQYYQERPDGKLKLGFNFCCSGMSFDLISHTRLVQCEQAGHEPHVTMAFSTPAGAWSMVMVLNRLLDLPTGCC